LLLKLGLRISPRTIRKYLPKFAIAPVGKPRGDQRWSTFLKNHAKVIIACDFCIVATVTFRILYVFVVMEHLSRRIVHANVTAHPTAAWTMQQLREAIPSDHACRFIIHDRDAIFSSDLDASAAGLGLKVVKTPVRSPKANALCERLIGTLRRECLDWIIPLTEGHLRKTLMSWLPHYNRGRPHSSLGPGIPDPTPGWPAHLQRHRHRFDRSTHIVARPSERTSPRVQLLGLRCLSVAEFLRTTNAHTAPNNRLRRIFRIGQLHFRVDQVLRRHNPLLPDPSH
jgi:putative transposase